MDATKLKDEIKSKYGEAAGKLAQSGQQLLRSFLLWGDPKSASTDVVTSNLYDQAQKSELPAEAVLGSAGLWQSDCAGATQSGEVVLDLGSGGGIDVCCQPGRVGATGKLCAGHDR